MPSGMPFRKIGASYGKCTHVREAEKKPKFPGAPPQPLQGLRPLARYYRKFELCRICLRIFALRGEIPGVIKSSW